MALRPHFVGFSTPTAQRLPVGSLNKSLSKRLVLLNSRNENLTEPRDRLLTALNNDHIILLTMTRLRVLLRHERIPKPPGFTGLLVQEMEMPTVCIRFPTDILLCIIMQTVTDARLDYFFLVVISGPLGEVHADAPPYADSGF